MLQVPLPCSATLGVFFAIVAYISGTAMEEKVNRCQNCSRKPR